MIRDTFFSTPRFVSICRKDLMENWRTTVLRIILIYGIMAVVMIFVGFITYADCYDYKSQNDPMWSFLLVGFVWTLFIFGWLSASFTMEKMKTNISRLSELMVPATSFEKFFSRWLICTIGFLVVFLITYKLADYTRVLLFSMIFSPLKQIAPVDLSHIVGDESYFTLFKTSLELKLMIAVYFFFQSCFVLGSSIWPKNTFLKTYLALMIITIIYVGFAGAILSNDSLRDDFNTNFMSQDTAFSVLIFACAFFALFNWVLAYFRFKESEIINRV